MSYIDLDGLEEADAGSKPANNNGNESINKKEEQQLLFFKTKKFQNELKSAELENAAIDYIYSKINQNIGSNSEIVQYRNGLRPSHETFIIKQTISLYITVNGVSDAVSVKSPETGEVAFLLNFVKKGASYAIGEALPFEAKALSGMFKSLGDLALKEALLAKGINSVSMKPKEWRAPRLIENSMRLSNVSKGIGSFLKIAGKSANLFGSVLLYYDLLNVNSPNRMDDSDIQEQTVNAMNVFLNSTKSNE